MAAAFAGIEQLKTVYSAAIKLNYKFYSYGDAMLLMR
jgi:S-adenosylmethionine:tRNA-ribosyltransferase-isomerase (queuine synthetase)